MSATGVVDPPVRGRSACGVTIDVGVVVGVVVSSDTTVVDVLDEPSPLIVVEVVEFPVVVVVV